MTIDLKHQQRMQSRKKVMDAKIAKSTEERGVFILLKGAGKGKSSSAFGTMARSVGHGKRCAVIQFTKGRTETGEYKFFSDHPLVDWHVMGHGFTWETQDKTQDISRKEAIQKIGNYGKYAALTALGTYMILNPQKAQAQSPTDPGNGF